MSKYNLVASYYDIFELNPNLRYKNKVIVDGEALGIPLSTLQAIDKFTASHTRTEIFKILEQKLGIQGKNHLAVQYQKNQSSTPTYYKILENNPDFIPCTEENKKIEYWAFGKKYCSLGILDTNPFFRKEKMQLRRLLEEHNYETLKERIPFANSMLQTLIKEYFDGAHDNVELEREELRKVIEIEFSRYKTFRGWIITKDSKTTNYSKNNEKTTSSPTAQTNKTIIPRTQAEYEEEFTKRFQEQHKKSWEQAITDQYNYHYEENLTPEEVETMFGLGEEGRAEMEDYSTKKAITKGRRR